MAIVQFTGIVNQIRGKLNGSVFNKARSVNTLQRKQQAPRRNVGNSSGPRNNFSQAQRSWKSLTISQRQQWATAAVNNPSRNRFGELVALSGYNQYIKSYIFALSVGINPVETPVTTPAPDPDIIISDWSQFDFSLAPSGRVEIEYNNILDSGWTGAGMYVIMDIGFPVSAGVTTYYGTYQFVAGEELDGVTFISGEQILSSRYPLPQSGQQVYRRTRVVYIPNGAVVYTLVERGIIN